MNIEEELTNISTKIDKYHEEYIRKASKAKYMNLSYILWGFSLAVTGLAISVTTAITIVIAIVFWISGFVSLFYSLKLKAD